MPVDAVAPRRSLATLLVILPLGCLFFDSRASAQPATATAPLFDCTLEHHLRLLDPGHPSQRGQIMHMQSGFVFDAASGIFRWRYRASGMLHDPERWAVLQRGTDRNDWLAVIEEFGRPRVLRIRMWGEHPGRFVLFDDLGAALTGRCR